MTAPVMLPFTFASPKNRPKNPNNGKSANTEKKTTRKQPAVRDVVEGLGDMAPVVPQHQNQLQQNCALTAREIPYEISKSAGLGSAIMYASKSSAW
jgi:hypothetical protein